MRTPRACSAASSGSVGGSPLDADEGGDRAWAERIGVARERLRRAHALLLAALAATRAQRLPQLRLGVGAGAAHRSSRTYG